MPTPQVHAPARSPRTSAAVLGWPLRLRIALADPLFTGFLGSCLVAVGAIAIGVTPKPDVVRNIPVLGLLRTTVLGQGIGTAAVIAGIAILLTVWLSIGRDLRAGVGPTTARLRNAFWLWSIPLVITPPLFSRDLYSYAAQANMTAHGFDPYKLGPFVLPGPFADSIDPLWATTPAPYGPVYLWLTSELSRLTGDSVYLTVIAMRLLSLVGIWLALRYLPRLARACRVDPTSAVWLGIINPLTLMHFVSAGHNDALMLGLIIAGLALALEGSPLLGAVAMAMAAGVKAPAAILLGVVGALWARQLRGERRSAVAPVSRERLFLGYVLAGGTAVVSFVTVTTLSGVGYGWIAALDTPGSVRTWLSPPTALGMVVGGITERVGITETSWGVVDLTRNLAAAAALCIVIWLYLRTRTIDPVRGAAFILFLLVALGPVVQPWYLMWALVPLAAGGIRAQNWSVFGKPRAWANEASVLMWGVLAMVVFSQINGSTMLGPFALTGTLACILVTGAVVYRARAAERKLFGAGSVFDLAALRPDLAVADPTATPPKSGVSRGTAAQLA